MTDDPQTTNAEAQWIEDSKNACPHCGGSGHKDDVSKTETTTKIRWWYIPLFIIVILPPMWSIEVMYLDFWVKPILKAAFRIWDGCHVG